VQIYRQSYCPTRRRNGYLPFVLYFAHITATRAIDDDRANTDRFSNKSGLNSQYRPSPFRPWYSYCRCSTLAFGIVMHFSASFLGGHS